MISKIRFLLTLFALILASQLRADTAAIAALALVNAVLGDWG